MFEKEAEEYQIRKHHQRLYGHKPVVMKELNTTFKDGAEFGYNKAFVEADKNLKAVVADFNKANEWHYIKDGNLPKENENVLIYSNRANHIGFYRNGFWFTNSDGCLDDDDIEVIAWKEIVLPELKESE